MIFIHIVSNRHCYFIPCIVFYVFVQECDKREADIRKSATNAGNHYQRQLKQIGISGEDVSILSLTKC